MAWREGTGGYLEPYWFEVPFGYCWTNGVPNINSACCYCGFHLDLHRPISNEQPIL